MKYSSNNHQLIIYYLVTEARPFLRVQFDWAECHVEVPGVMSWNLVEAVCLLVEKIRPNNVDIHQSPLRMLDQDSHSNFKICIVRFLI